MILPEFLQVVLLTSCYLDATLHPLHIGGSEEKRCDVCGNVMKTQGDRIHLCPSTHIALDWTL